jgi:ATP-binding protein involved in chromosome partitioning
MDMTEITKEQVLETLATVLGPDLEHNIVELGMVSDVFISDGKVYFSITVPADRAKELEPLRLAAERVIKDMPGVKGALVALTADKKGASAARRITSAATGRPAITAIRIPRSRSSAPARSACPASAPSLRSPPARAGSAKSTTAVNLALGLQANGLRVGILDADIYGPSMPRLLQISGRPTQIDGRIINPMENYGLKVMSMGFLVDEETAMIWRGPMVQSALMQMLREVAWGELDVLVVDMPPGTGDAQLTMAQQVPLAGAVIVSTPQDLALIDARKGLNMFKKVEVPVLGIVENMSYFIAPDTGARYDIFGHGGARKEAERIGVPFLGEVPLTINIRETSDAGTPLVASEPDGIIAGIYRDIAAKVWAQLENKPQRAAPAIVFE